MWFRILTVLVVLAATTGAGDWSFAPPDELPDPDDYQIYVVEDWTVHVNKQLLSFHGRLALDTLDVLQTQLGRVTQVLPAGILERLQQVPIWVELSLDNKITNAPAFYRSLRQGGADDGWRYPTEGSVVIREARLFAYGTRGHPMVLLHELAHAYHDQVLGFDYDGIRRLYLDAKTSGRYDNVPTVYGKRLPAYAMTNAQEYFAELSEAYFGRNDFFPFRRKDLRGFDPGMFGLLNSLWQER
ncbi:MAG: hypothetical protein CMM08_12930 [Rhodospirillaceae bacterium]|nr:hypothetical protein [Rhodospirillaceae bacterium]